MFDSPMLFLVLAFVVLSLVASFFIQRSIYRTGQKVVKELPSEYSSLRPLLKFVQTTANPWVELVLFIIVAIIGVIVAARSL